MAEVKEAKMTLSGAADKLTNELLADVVAKSSKGLTFPVGYNASSEIVGIMLKIKQTVDKNGQPVLATCTADSIKQAVWDTVVKGLYPSKNQCYFIAYDNKLSCVESYFGLQMRAKRADPNIDDIFAQVVYEGDILEYVIEDGSKRITSHIQNIDNIDNNKIKGAYATIKYKDGSSVSEYMTMQQIRVSWSKSKTSQGVHKEFPDMMAKRTVLKRLTNSVVNTSKDEPLLNDHIGASEFDAQADVEEATVVIDVTPDDEPEQPESKDTKELTEELPDCLK